MQNAILYCDRCGRIILPSVIAEGTAITSETTSLCPDCVRRLPPEQRESLRRADEPRSVSPTLSRLQKPPVGPGREGRHQRGSQRGAPIPPKALKYVGVMAGAGLLAGFAATLLIVGTKRSTSPQEVLPPSSGVARPPPAPSVVVDTAQTAQPDTDATPARQQIAKIRAMKSPTLANYGEMRALLVAFPASFADAPEAEEAQQLLRELDALYAKRADDALAAAIRSADGMASKGDYDGAVGVVRSVSSQFDDGPWLVSGGSAKVAQAIGEIEKKRAGHILARAREASEAGRLNEARKLLESHPKWTPDDRSKADALLAEIERQVAAAASAKKLAEERAAILAEFDRLMTSGEYAGARDYAKSKVAAGGQDAGILRGGKDLARRLAEEPAARIRGARSLIGRKVRLKLTTGHRTAIVKAATEVGLAGVTTYTINNQTRERPLDLKWDTLHAEQKAEFARLGGLEMSPSDEAIMATYAALASDDLEVAGKAADAAGDHPLGKHLAAVVRTRVKQRAYESAMRRARELVEKKELKDAALECEKALEAMPDDEKASALLAELRRLLAAPKTLTLDLGNGVTMEFVYIKPGTFVMGGESTSEGRFHAVETPKHTVTITKGFYLGKYEVTQAQFQVVMGKNPSKSTRDPNCPVDNVSWHDAKEFCKRAAEKTGGKVRLPTEAEWEYACRAGTDTDWSHGSDPAKLVEYAWTADNAGGRSHPVGQKKPNPWGLYDIHGNVCERIADMYHRDYYANSPKEDPTGADVGYGRGARGTSILRGGTWKGGADESRSGARLRGGGYGFYDNWGLRAAVTAPVEGGTEAPPAPTPSRKLAGATSTTTYNAGHAEAMVEPMQKQ